MTNPLTKTHLAQLSEFVAAQVGWHYPPERWTELERGIRQAAPALGFDAECVAACIDWLLTTPLTQTQLEVLARHLTVGETYFFREPKGIEALQNHILPHLSETRQSHKRLKIWSAGCASGEEPYSIAMLLDRMRPHFTEWQFTILATDINPASLQRAAAGCYREWSFRGTPAWVKQTYFCQISPQSFELEPRIRRLVRLAHLDLAQPVYPSFLNQTQAIDVIFCRNVLMYFTPTMMQAIVDRFFEALVPGGWLIVSPSEATHPLFSAFTSCQLAGVVLHQKPKLTGIQAWAGVSDEQNFEGVLTPQPSPQLSPSPDVGIRLSPPAGSRPELVEGRLGGLSEPMEVLTLARAAANRGQLAEAQVWCEQALAANKLNPNAHYLLAVIFEAQGQPAKARQALNRALYLDPDFALAHLALGHLVQRQEGPTQASKHFKNALTLLKRLPPATPLPEAEGLTSGRLIELIEGLL